MDTGLADESAAAFGRWNLALCAMLAVMSAVCVLAPDRSVLVQLTVKYAWVSAPYVAIVVLVAIGAQRAPAWISVAVAAVVLVAAGAGVVSSQGAVVAALAYFEPGLMPPLILLIAAHGFLLGCAVSLLRGGTAGSSGLAVVLSLSLLAVVGFVVAMLG